MSFEFDAKEQTVEHLFASKSLSETIHQSPPQPNQPQAAHEDRRGQRGCCGRQEQRARDSALQMQQQ